MSVLSVYTVVVVGGIFLHCQGHNTSLPTGCHPSGLSTPGPSHRSHWPILLWPQRHEDSLLLESLHACTPGQPALPAPCVCQPRSEQLSVSTGVSLSTQLLLPSGVSQTDRPHLTTSNHIPIPPPTHTPPPPPCVQVKEDFVHGSLHPPVSVNNAIWMVASDMAKEAVEKDKSFNDFR